jgi:hypoxanthine phosphoribosyltransferase
MNPDLYISWNEYHQLIESLATQIYQSQWEFDQILCLARGGLRIGDVLSRLYNVPLAIVAANSYVGHQRHDLTLSHSITMTSAALGQKLLIVDDLVDSGVTLQAVQTWLHQEFPQTQTRTAVLWYKAQSVVKPDYFVTYLDHNPWIHQPFEKYENMHPRDLRPQNT